MPYEVCYRALLSISVVEGLKPQCHTHATCTRRSRRAPARRGLYNPLRGAFAGLDHNVRVHPEHSLAGGPPARCFVIYFFDILYKTVHYYVY